MTTPHTLRPILLAIFLVTCSLLHAQEFAASDTILFHNGKRVAVFSSASRPACIPSNDQRTVDQQPRMLAYASIDLSVVSPSLVAMKTGPRIGLVVSRSPSGWGGGYAYQRLAWRGEGVPTSEPYNLWYYTHSKPQDRLSVHSFLVSKAFNLHSSSVVRPFAEAGISFVRYEQGALVISEFLFGSDEYFEAHATSNSVGSDLRLGALFAVSRALGFAVAAHTNINAYHSYSSFEFGIALGLVRPTRMKQNTIQH